MTNIWNRYVESAASRYGVPPALVSSVIGAESSGRPGAVSGKGAGGLMQLMPDTFAELRTKYGLGADRFDPETNISAGTAYLGDLYKQFGNWPDAISAYNAGPGRWAQVKAGTASAPRETVDYAKKVTAAFGQGDQTQGADVPLFSSSQSRSLTGLLDVDQDKNFYDGLGLLGNFGQTPSQPPRTDPAALPNTTQTDRLGASSRINDLIEQYLQQPQKAGPSQLQYMLAGAQKGIQGLAGVHDRKVGIGEMLAGLGGGVTSGGLAYDEAVQQRQSSELDRLLKAGAYQNQQRTADLNEANAVFDNQYKQALTNKASRSEVDPKVVGKGVYVDGKWIQAPWANGSDGSGPLEGTGIDAQMTNLYVTLEQKRVNGQPLTQQEELLYGAAVRHLNKPKLVPGPDGVVRSVPPEPMPTIGGAGGGAAVPAPGPAPAAAGGPAPAPAPTGSRVTEIVPPKPKEIPATAQNNLITNAGALRKAEDALAAITKTPDATGFTAGLLNYLPFGAVDKVMPGGTEARAAIADIGSLKIHDRSGAAVTVSEFPRLAPFVPQVSDDAATVKLKLERFRVELANEIRDQAQIYGIDQGYKGNLILGEVLKTGKAPRYQAPISGQDPNAPGPKVMRFDAQGNLIP